MAKTAKPKKAKTVSIHSRAAKRATSPSIDTDKSLKSAKPPSDSSHVLSVHYGAGIVKRKAKNKPINRHKRLRQEKGQARAEVVMDQNEKKLQRSLRKEKVINERNISWDDLNSTIPVAKPKKKLPKKSDLDDDEWEDSLTDEEVVYGVTELTLDSTSSTGLKWGPTEPKKVMEEEEEL